MNTEVSTTTVTPKPKTPKRKKLPGLNKAKSLRMNAWGEAALAQVNEFFLTVANEKLSNAILFSIALADYRNHLTQRMKAANRLEGDERKDAIDRLVYEEMAKVRFLRGRSD
jgi:hypothetical protein